jgi:hypothetical protein
VGSCWPAGSSSEAPTLDFDRGPGRFAGPIPAVTELSEFNLDSTEGDCQPAFFEYGRSALNQQGCSRSTHACRGACRPSAGPGHWGV